MRIFPWNDDIIGIVKAQDAGINWAKYNHTIKTLETLKTTQGDANQETLKKALTVMQDILQVASAYVTTTHPFLTERERKSWSSMKHCAEVRIGIITNEIPQVAFEATIQPILDKISPLIDSLDKTMERVTKLSKNLKKTDMEIFILDFSKAKSKLKEIQGLLSFISNSLKKAQKNSSQKKIYAGDSYRDFFRRSTKHSDELNLIAKTIIDHKLKTLQEPFLQVSEGVEILQKTPQDTTVDQKEIPKELNQIKQTLEQLQTMYSGYHSDLNKASVKINNLLIEYALTQALYPAIAKIEQDLKTLQKKQQDPKVNTEPLQKKIHENIQLVYEELRKVQERYPNYRSTAHEKFRSLEGDFLSIGDTILQDRIPIWLESTIKDIELLEGKRWHPDFDTPTFQKKIKRQLMQLDAIESSMKILSRNDFSLSFSHDSASTKAYYKLYTAIKALRAIDQVKDYMLDLQPAIKSLLAPNLSSEKDKETHKKELITIFVQAAYLASSTGNPFGNTLDDIQKGSPYNWPDKYYVSKTLKTAHFTLSKLWAYKQVPLLLDQMLQPSFLAQFNKTQIDSMIEATLSSETYDLIDPKTNQKVSILQKLLQYYPKNQKADKICDIFMQHPLKLFAQGHLVSNSSKQLADEHWLIIFSQLLYASYNKNPSLIKKLCENRPELSTKILKYAAITIGTMHRLFASTCHVVGALVSIPVWAFTQTMRLLPKRFMIQTAVISLFSIFLIPITAPIELANTIVSATRSTVQSTLSKLFAQFLHKNPRKKLPTAFLLIKSAALFIVIAPAALIQTGTAYAWDALDRTAQNLTSYTRKIRRKIQSS